jgi:hypothetical protein
MSFTAPESNISLKRSSLSSQTPADAGSRIRQEARAQPPGREEQRGEQRLEQERVPLVLEEEVADPHQRQVGEPGDRDHRAGRDVGDEEQRGERADRDQRGEEPVAGRQPGEGGELEEAAQRAPVVRVGVGANGVHEVGGRRDAARQEQPLHLHPHREEGAQGGDAEQAQEDPAGQAVLRRRRCRADEQTAQPAHRGARSACALVYHGVASRSWSRSPQAVRGKS